jgi:AbrB family looped-hinge helix DNA binding protein
MPFVKVGPRHQITIPQEVRKAIGIEAGDLLEVMAQQGKVVIMPKQFVSEKPVAKLTAEEQELLITAKQKIKAINKDMINSTGLIREEADVAAKAGLIDPGQKWWWLEAWQEGEREAERDIKEGRVETFENPKDFLTSLETL